MRVASLLMVSALHRRRRTYLALFPSHGQHGHLSLAWNTLATFSVKPEHSCRRGRLA